MMTLFLILILSYFAGSIPTAIIVSRLVLKDDIRNHGSKNAGATNVFRVMGWKPALFVVLVDIGKGVLATLVISQIGTVAIEQTLIQMMAGFAAIAGHIWTVFAGFKGGKGVGTAFGVLLSLAPLASLITFGVWLIIVLLIRIVSIGSLTAGFVFPIVLFLQKQLFDSNVPDSILILGVVLCVLVLITHRSNIKRLIDGTENRFGSK